MLSIKTQGKDANIGVGDNSCRTEQIFEKTYICGSISWFLNAPVAILVGPAEDHNNAISAEYSYNLISSARSSVGRAVAF